VHVPEIPRKFLENHNIWALRALAEKCDATVPSATRQDFIKEGHILDPLLPYVLFTHLAAKCAEVFKQDYEYWKDKAPDSAVVGKLFRAALEEGKKIVEQKEKGKE